MSALFGHGHSVLWIAGGLAITIAFCLALRGAAGQVDPRGRRGLARAGLVAIAVLAALACVVYGKDWTPLWIYVSAATGMVLAGTPGGRRSAMRGVFAVGACYVFFSWLSHDDPADFFVVLLPVLLIGLAMIGFRLQMQLMRRAGPGPGDGGQTGRQRRAAPAGPGHARPDRPVAVDDHAEGRAGRQAAVPARSRRPIATRRSATSAISAGVSRQTLHDIREAVSGYRRPTLAIEAITARNALEAAGIQLDDDPALTLRSGTLRRRRRGGPGLVPARGGHQRDPALRRDGLPDPPDRASGELCLEIADDGHGPALGPADQETPKGAGLRGMSERLSAVGGRLSLGAAEPGRGHAISRVAGAGTGSGFTLTATVPVDRYDT